MKLGSNNSSNPWFPAGAKWDPKAATRRKQINDEAKMPTSEVTGTNSKSKVKDFKKEFFGC